METTPESMKFALTTCLLLATSALAQSVQPIDYNDDPHLRVNPAAGHIFFNYQQLRFDQPPQVDIRDEDVGRYMYRTRTTPAPLLSTPMIPFEEINIDFSPFNKVQAEKRYPSVDIWQTRATTRTTPAPTTTLKWEKFSENVQVGNHPQQFPSPWASQIQAHSMVALAPPTSAPRRPLEASTTTVQPQMWQEAVRQPVPQAWQETHPLGAYRGNHKFNWDDVLLPQSPPQREVPISRTTTTTAAPTAPYKQYAPRTYPGGVPPVPPTLTPWSGDNLR